MSTMVTNLNRFEGIGLHLGIKRLPELEFFCRRVDIPSISSAHVERASQLKIVPEHGDRIVYAPLDVTFFVDENMKNYKEIYNWIQAYTTPDKAKDYLTKSKTQGTGLLRSDISVTLLKDKFNPVRNFVFTDAFPSDLSSIVIESNGNEIPVMLCTVTFQYVSFNIE